MSLAAEDAVLGAILVSDVALPAIMDTGLRPEHFNQGQRRALYTSMLTIFDRGERIDRITLAAHDFRPEILDELRLSVVSPGNALAYARDIIETALWRERNLAGQDMILAAQIRDEALFARGEQRLAKGIHIENSTWSPERLAAALAEAIDNPGEAFPLPFARLNTLTNGGLRRGQVTLLGGWTSHGKSVLLDQILGEVAVRSKVHLYINEMTPRERGMRWLARETNVQLGHLISGAIDERAARRVMSRLEVGFPYPMTDVAGWSATEICRHIRRERPDVAALDILHLIPHRDEADLRDISRELNVTAKRADCHVIATVHLNESRVQGTTRPMPTTGDIRGSGMLKNDADLVLFVFREQDADTGYPQSDASIYFAKQRAGALGGMSAHFDDRSIAFSEEAL